VGTRLFVIGGVGSSPLMTLVYDATTNTWQQHTAIPTARDHLAAVEVNGRIYAIAGRHNGRNLNTVEAYAIAQDTWTTLPPLPTTRSGLAAAVLGSAIFVTGGEALDGSGRTYAQLEIFDTDTQRWRKGTPLPTSRHGLAAVAHQGRIYILAGGPTAGLSVSDKNEVYLP
jgi:N-acetylneuraminic acid mutarotase